MPPLQGRSWAFIRGGIDEKVVILFFYLKTNKVVKVRKNKKLNYLSIFSLSLDKIRGRGPIKSVGICFINIHLVYKIFQIFSNENNNQIKWNRI